MYSEAAIGPTEGKKKWRDNVGTIVMFQNTLGTSENFVWKGGGTGKT